MPGLAHSVLTIEITGGVEGALPIAVIPFDSSEIAHKLPVDIAEIVTNNLNRSGVLKVMPRIKLPAKPHYSNQVSYPTWRVAAQEYLVVGRIQDNATGDYEIQFQLLDVIKQKQIVGYSLPVKKRNLRASAHEISDLIYEAITGIRGAFNTRIAYISAQRNEARKYILQVADTDGFNPQTILESDEPLMSPAWSPDGQSLAYVSFENNKAEIFIQHLATARRSNVSSFKGINSAPAWSPDGKFMALVLSKDGSADIYILNLETRRMKRLTTHRRIDTEPAWMPDGSSIIFTSDRSGSPQIYEVSINGGAAKRLTFEGRYNSAASVSPDGKFISMVHGDRGQYRIAQLEIESGNLTVLTEASLDESPSFSPNGKMVLYASTRGDNGVLYAVTVDGRSKHKLSDQSGDIREPVWGPFKRRKSN
ncbi:MAG: TolB protein [Gammaproteobacteria bacterium]|jgi:TolB protein